MVKKPRAKWSQEQRSAGTNPDFTELDESVIDLIEKSNVADSERKRKVIEKLKINKSKPEKCYRLHKKHFLKHKKV